MDMSDGNAGARGRVRIRKIEVKGLCGYYHHEIELNRDERVTILHGPNGVGKTAVLRMIHALFSGKLGSFGRVPFDSLRVWLESSIRSNLGELLVTSSKPDETEAGMNESEVQLTWDQETWHSHLQIAENDQSWDTTTWMLDMRKRVGTFLIETQRLQQWEDQEGYPPELVDAVSGDAADLARRISDTMARFGRDGQALEQTFPQRLLKMGNGQTVLGSESLRQRMAALDTRRAELEMLGLLEQVESHPIDPGDFDGLESTEKKVLTLYVEDSEKKLDILQDLASRIRLFLSFLNGKFRHKRISIERESGFVARGDDGSPLDLETLSSGEQHELVLLYDLLFRIEPDTLVLIDEPEISLHLAWQRQFLPELLEIVKVARFDALVATHSPFIVGDRSDLMIALSDEI